MELWACNAITSAANPAATIYSKILGIDNYSEETGTPICVLTDNLSHNNLS